jgi:hypothetical protein
LGTSLGILGKGTVALSSETAQGVLQLAERTAAIQFMRDQMYRACEAYANGALTGTNYSLLMSRINETMVTLLLGETAGGAFGRSLGAMGGKASSQSAATLAGFPAALDDIRKSSEVLANAEVKVSKAEAKLAEAKAKKETADAQGDGEEAKKEKEAAQKTVDTAQTELQQAKGSRDALKEMLKHKLESTSQSAGEISQVAAAGGIAAKPTPELARVLADMQESLLQRNPSHSLVDACLVELGMWNTNSEAAEHFLNVSEKLIASPKEEKEASAEEKAKAEKKAHQYEIMAYATNARLYRTGLFDFCNDRLSGIASDIRSRDTALRMKKLSLEEQSLDVRQMEVRSKAMGDLAAALAQCDRISERASKSVCKARVLGVEEIELPNPGTPRGGSPPARPSLPLPTMLFDKALTAINGVKEQKALLSALNFPDLDGNLDATVKEMRTKEREDLNKRRTALVDKVAGEIKQVEDAYVSKKSDAERQMLVGLEREATDLESKRNLETDRDQKRILNAQLIAARGKKEKISTKYGGVARTMAHKQRELIGLSAEFKKAGAK